MIKNTFSYIFEVISIFSMALAAIGGLALTAFALNALN